MDTFLHGSHQGRPNLTLLNVLNILNVLNVLKMPKDPSLACWALFSKIPENVFLNVKRLRKKSKKLFLKFQ